MFVFVNSVVLISGWPKYTKKLAAQKDLLGHYGGGGGGGGGEGEGRERSK